MASPTPSDDNVSKRDVDGGFAWIIVLVVMLNFFNLSLHFAAFSVLYLEYVETFDMTVGQIGIAMSVNSCFTNLAGKTNKQKKSEQLMIGTLHQVDH